MLSVHCDDLLTLWCRAIPIFGCAAPLFSDTIDAMNDNGYIMSFSSADSMEPRAAAKLNNNFRFLLSQIKDPEIVMAAGYTLPDPRVDETLFYQLDTGDLYIWSKFIPVDPETLEPQEPYWDWMKLDINTIEQVSVAPSGVRDDKALVKYLVDPAGAMPFFWVDAGDTPRAGWYSLRDLVHGWINEWISDSDNIDTLKSVLGLN